MITEFFRQLKYILTITKPKHIYNAMKAPHHTVKVLKYHYRRVSEPAFIDFFSKQWGCSDRDIIQAYTGLSNNAPLWQEIKEKLSIYPSGYGLQMTRELPCLYLLIRLTQPDAIIETGVSSGASSAYILRSLHDNNRGRLYSIDLPPDNLPEGKESGWVVPDYLRDRWTLRIGDSKKLLEPLLESIGEIDCFIHDSLHTYEHMIWEFRKAWGHLRSGGLFLSHDVGGNDAFFDLMHEEQIPWSKYRVVHVLGGFIKPNNHKRASLIVNLPG
jgi:predicted O-methyltransferase YrrM